MKNDMPPRHKTLKKVIAAASFSSIAAAVFFIWYYLREPGLYAFMQSSTPFSGKETGNRSLLKQRKASYTPFIIAPRILPFPVSAPANSMSGISPSPTATEKRKSGRSPITPCGTNQDKYWLLSPKRYSARQALTQELMDLSSGMAGQQVLDEILRDILPEREADCINVEISYRNGNPPPGTYSRLIRQSWFTWSRSAPPNT